MCIASKVNQNFKGVTHFDIKSESVNGVSKIECTIVSPEFNEMDPGERQEKLNQIIGPEAEQVNEFDMKTYTPEQWEKEHPNNELEFEKMKEPEPALMIDPVPDFTL